ncbi:hypothetical protein O3G_MSEX006336 [Manduca sexta]|uniref:Uncharacterized protein n=1 Tax=Manduca sexta TaxID=7130 RepID=A0A921Z308_MANSE|nr:hypothetical protein O3G_MSEX006336 [Manduca sexta]KAG6449966.1 hypothetical protein O3G_MSEX006336 [Manduca sexta]
MAELAEAAGCESSISTPDLLTAVINQIQNATIGKSSDEIDKLRRINENLMSQINKLENQLKLHCPEFDSIDSDENDASDSDQQSTKSYESVSRVTRPRTKNTVSTIILNY